MKKIEKTNHDCWYLAYSEANFIYGKLDAGHELVTGQPNLECFETEETWRARIYELKGDSFEIEDLNNFDK